MQRGEVWWANLSPPAGRRPVLLLSRNAAYAVRNAVTVSPITRTVRGIPVEVNLGPDDGMPAGCAVNLDGIVTIGKSCLTQRITSLSTLKMRAVSSAIKYALALER